MLKKGQRTQDSIGSRLSFQGMLANADDAVFKHLCHEGIQ